MPRIRIHVVASVVLAGAGLAQAQATKPADRFAPFWAPPPANPAVEQSLLRELGREFKLHEASHFVVAYDGDPKRVRDLSRRLKSTYHSVVKIGLGSGLPLKPLGARLHVVFFDRYEDYVAYAQRHEFLADGTFGFYNEPDNRSAFFNAANDPKAAEMRRQLTRSEQQIKWAQRQGMRGRLVQLRNEVAGAKTRLERRADDINRTVIRHEAAHQLLFNLGVQKRFVANPRWLAEGLATVFETPNGGPFVVNRGRLRDFNQADADNLLSPLRRFVANPPGGIFIVRRSSPEFGYAQSWALVRYLMHKKRDKLGEYLKAIASRKVDQEVSPSEELALFESMFGRLDPKFEQRWLNYIRHLPK